MRIRTDFITNSSSTSFVVIDSKHGHFFPNFESSVLVVDSTLGETEFGWGPEIIRDLGSKINFAYIQTNYGKNEEWLNMLADVITENTNIKTIVWNITDEYDSKDGKSWGYIDHQSSAHEGENTEIFDSKDVLKDFIFGRKSCIVLDNDNY